MFYVNYISMKKFFPNGFIISLGITNEMPCSNRKSWMIIYNKKVKPKY